MKKNVGLADRITRTVAAVIIAALLFSGQVSGVVATILGVLAAVLLVTAIVGFCPLYALLKVSTAKSLSPQVK